MAAILSLKKEAEKISKKVNFGKTTFDFDKNIKDTVKKIIRKSRPKFDVSIQGMSIIDLQKELQSRFKHFEIIVSDIENPLVAKSICRQFLKPLYSSKEFLNSDFFNEPKECTHVVKLDIRLDGKNILETQLFTVPGVPLPPKTIKHRYISYELEGTTRQRVYKVLDLEYIISILATMEMCYDYLIIDDDIIKDVKNTYYSQSYTQDDVNRLLNVVYLGESSSDYIPKKTEYLICEAVIALTHIQSSIMFDKAYRKELESDYARSNETKKNIPQKQLDVMKNNIFLENFSFVELDEITDINKFRLIEREFINLRTVLNLNEFLKNKPELRFRRLGQHKAAGLYYPTEQCVCIDVGSPYSFVHEIGHHIDLSGEEELSSKIEFRLLAIEYKKELDKAANKSCNEKDVDYYKRKKGYFHTPTEIFARCLEIYLSVSKKMTSSFLTQQGDMKFTRGYPKLTDTLHKKIDEYFGKLFIINEGIDTTLNDDEQLVLLTELEKIAQENKTNLPINKVEKFKEKLTFTEKNEIDVSKVIDSRCLKIESFHGGPQMSFF